MRSTQREAMPWMAYAPALSNGSPLATYAAISRSESGLKTTRVISASVCSKSGATRHTPVIT